MCSSWLSIFLTWIFWLCFFFRALLCLAILNHEHHIRLMWCWNMWLISRWLSHETTYIHTTHRSGIDQSHRSHDALLPYPTTHHSEQKCAHLCSEWCIVGCGTGALWDLWDQSMSLWQNLALTCKTEKIAYIIICNTDVKSLSQLFFK